MIKIILLRNISSGTHGIHMNIITLTLKTKSQEIGWQLTSVNYSAFQRGCSFSNLSKCLVMLRR